MSRKGISHGYVELRTITISSCADLVQVMTMIEIEDSACQSINLFQYVDGQLQKIFWKKGKVHKNQVWKFTFEFR